MRRTPVCPIKLQPLLGNVAAIGMLEAVEPSAAKSIALCSGSTCAWWRTESTPVVADDAPTGRCGAAFTGPGDTFPDPAHRPAAKG